MTKRPVASDRSIVVSGHPRTGLRPAVTRQSVWLGAVALLFWVGHTMLRPLLAPYAAELATPPALIGLIVAAQALPAVLFAIPVGAALDRRGTHRILIGGVALMVVGGLVLLPARDVSGLLAAQVLLGFGTLAVWLTIQSMVTFGPTMESPTQRSRRIANFSVCIVTGQLVGPLLGGGRR